MAIRSEGLLARLYNSPSTLLVIVAISVFASECLALLVLSYRPDLPSRAAIFIDSAILILFIFPCLNFFLFRPLVLHIREHRQAEEALRRSEYILTEAQRIAHIGNWDLDLVHNVLNWSDEIYRIFEIDPQESRASYETFLETVHPDDREAVNRAFRESVKDGTPYSIVHRLLMSDGRIKYVRERGETFYDVANQPLRSIGTVQDVTERVKAEEELRESQEQLRSLSAHLQAAREMERAAIAREIHDELGQMLAALQFNVSVVAGGLREDQTFLADQVASMAQLIEESVKTVQRISSELRPVMIDDLGLAAAMEWQAKEFERRSGLTCELVTSLKSDDVGREVATAVFRIFQESMTNVLRHAHATRVEVSLIEKRGRLELAIRDDGRGISREELRNPLSFGLVGMRERVVTLGGRIRIWGARNKGTVVVVRIPVARKKGCKHEENPCCR
ncbi:MAG TPA: PAS domain-containing protein [Geobacteraceae bacterium]